MISPHAHIHPSATISEKAVIEPGAVIGADTVIEDGVCVEAHAVIGYHAEEGKGQGTVLQQGSLVATCATIYHSVVIGPKAKVRHQVVIREVTQIGEGTSVGSMSIIEHHCKVGKYCSLHGRIFLSDYSEVGDFVFVGPGFISTSDPVMCYRRPHIKVPWVGVTLQRGCRIGGGVLALPGARVGEEAVVGAGAVLRGDLPGRLLYVGNPARAVRKVSESEFLP